MRSILIAVLFLLMLLLPVANLDNRLGLDVVAPLDEKRNLATFPSIKANLSDLKQFPTRFQDFFGDHFGGRNTLVWLDSAIGIKVFDQSPSKNVTIGQNEWLYITVGNSNEVHMGLRSLNESQLRNIKDLLERRQRALQNLKVPYIFVVAPNKQTMYPEYLPPNLNRVQGPTERELFFTYMRQHSSFRPIDLQEPLLEAKKTGPIFHKTDSHWNARGAQVGYSVIMNEVHRYLPNTPVFSPLVQDEVGGPCCNDLSLFMGTPSLYPAERFTEFSLPPLHHSETAIAIPGKRPRAAFLTVNTNSDLPTAVILGDSFINWYMRSLMAESFSRAVFIESGYVDNDPVQLAETFHPDVLVTEVVERSLEPCFSSALK